MKITLYIPKENNTFDPLEINVDDSSYHYKEIMGDDNVVLNFSLPDFIELPVGTYFMYKDTYKYTLYSPQNFKKNHSRHYDYTLTLESELAQLKTIKFKMFVAKYENGVAVTMDTSPRLKFSFTGTPYEFARLLADNLNLSGNEAGWMANKAACVDSERVTLDFNHDYCHDVLTRIAEAFNTEWDVEGKEIRFDKVEKMKESTVKLSYGYKKGVLGGISRSQFDTSKVINRVWIQGGDRNIRWDTYGNDTLLMPKDNTVRYDGTYFGDTDPDMIDPEKAVAYRTDLTGCYVERADRTGPLLEDSLDVSKVYPMREGTVTGAYQNNGFWYIEDSDIPASLDFAKCVLPGENMTVIFQTGMLAGREFEVVYTHDTPAVNRRFQLMGKEENGQKIPGDAFIPKADDIYGVFHIALPEEYIEDAERRARDEAIKYLYENAQPKYTYDWQLDGIYAKREWGVSGGMLGCGNFVRFSDPQFLSEPVDIRITAVKTILSSPLSPQITISNNVSGKSLGNILNEIPAKEQEIERGKQEAIDYAKRRWKDTQELIDNISGMTDEFKENLFNALVFEGMVFRAGAATLQYRFLADDWDTSIEPDLIFNKTEKRFYCPASRIKHETLEIDGQKPYWTAPEYNTDVLDASTPYYLYLKCSKNLAVVDGRLTGEAVFFISAEKIKIEDQDGFYTLWVAFINSENEEGDRSFTTMYGLAELLPGQLTVDTLRSSDGKSFWKALKNQFKLGDGDNSLEYNLDPDMPNTLVASNIYIRQALKVIGEALIAGFYFSDQIIRSKAKTGIDDAMVLDGLNGSLQFNNYIERWKESGGMETKKQYIKIDSSSDDARVEARNVTDGDVAYLSSQGVFANRAGIDTLPASTGVSMKAAIAGLGRGKMDKDMWGSEWGIVGVYGTASNSSANPAPAYGGWFDMLKVNGLVMNMIDLSGGGGEITRLSRGTTYVLGNSTGAQHVYLPTDVYKGTTIWFKQWWTGYMRIYAPLNQRLFDDSSENEYLDVGEGWTAMCTYIGEWGSSQSEYKGTWMFSKFKF